VTLWLLKSLGAPGSIPFLVLACLIGVALLFLRPQAKRAARVWLASVFGLYGVLSVPAVASLIAGRLPPVPPQPGLQGTRLDTLIVFDGDNRRGRVSESKRLVDLTHPERVWLLGNAWMYDALWHAGVPYNDIRLDSNPPNTRAQVAWVEGFFAAHPRARAALVASRLQMPRVAALLTAAHVPVVLAPSPIDREPSSSGWMRWVPSYYALRVSRDALYEHAAIRYYRWKGWIS
jgi:DUF218 domain